MWIHCLSGAQKCHSVITFGFLCVISCFSFVADRPGLKEITEIQKLYEKVLAALKMEIGKNPNNEEDLLNRLLQYAWPLRNLSTQHIVLLNKFKQTAPEVEFPALHKELFSVEGLEAS